MSTLRRHYEPNHLHYITSSTYRRARLFDSKVFKERWVAIVDGLRGELNFRVVGYVLIPEHFHLLLWPAAEANPSQIVQRLKDRTALFILKILKDNSGHAWRHKMLARVALPPSVHHHSHFRVWQRRFHDMNIWAPKNREEKLNYMHYNPVKRGLRPVCSLATCHSPLL